MSNAAQIRADYREMISDVGETITLRRMSQSGPPADFQVLARVTGYQPKELVGGIKQGDRRLIVLAEDVETSGFPLPFKTSGTDKAIVRDKVLNIGIVDDSTRRVGGVLIAYDITATGG
jgi:hypothetical protein